MLSKFEFLSATRFWVMVIGCLGVAAQGNFTQEAWLKALSAFVVGFIAVRTADRVGEQVGS